MTAPFLDAEAVRRETIAAYRYLAYLDREYRALVRELKPEHRPGDMVFHPCDEQVDDLVANGSAIERAATVLQVIGIDPYAHAGWADFIGVDMSSIPISGTVGGKPPGKEGR